jgi:hypothetical protein
MLAVSVFGGRVRWVVLCPEQTSPLSVSNKKWTGIDASVFGAIEGIDEGLHSQTTYFV